MTDLNEIEVRARHSTRACVDRLPVTRHLSLVTFLL